MDSLLWLIAGLFAALFLYSSAEAASQLLSALKLQLMLDSLRDRSSLAKKLLPRKSGALRSVLSYGRLLCLAGMAIALGILASGEQYWLAIPICIVAIVGAIYLPTILAAGNPQRIIKILLPLIQLGNLVLLPLTWPQRALFDRHKGKKRKKGGAKGNEEEAHEIEAYLDAAREEGLFKPDEEELVRQVAEFGDTVVREVMSPRVDMVCVENKSNLEQFAQLASQHKFSRLPVIEGIIDKVVGIAHIKALLDYPVSELDKIRVSEIMSPPYFVPESKRVSSLLRDIQARKQHMAIVVDEYGGTAGLITLEDIIEEIVGEIEDEHDEDLQEADIVKQTDGSLVVAGSVDVDEVEELLKIELDDEKYETVSGLALNYLKRIPKAGEAFETRGILVEILEADEKSIIKLRISKSDTQGTDA